MKPWQVNTLHLLGSAASTSQTAITIFFWAGRYWHSHKI
jgi:hypothetical protein